MPVLSQFEFYKDPHRLRNRNFLPNYPHRQLADLNFNIRKFQFYYARALSLQRDIGHLQFLWRQGGVNAGHYLNLTNNYVHLTGHINNLSEFLGSSLKGSLGNAIGMYFSSEILGYSIITPVSNLAVTNTKAADFICLSNGNRFPVGLALIECKFTESNDVEDIRDKLSEGLRQIRGTQTQGYPIRRSFVVCTSISGTNNNSNGLYFTDPEMSASPPSIEQIKSIIYSNYLYYLFWIDKRNNFYFNQEILKKEFAPLEDFLRFLLSIEENYISFRTSNLLEGTIIFSLKVIKSILNAQTLDELLSALRQDTLKDIRGAINCGDGVYFK